MTGRTRANLVIVVAFALTSVIGMEWLALNLGQPDPFNSGYTLHADFADAQGLVPGDDVRISGVDVGHVTQVAADSQNPGYTEVTVSLEDGPAVPVYSNGTAMVSQKSLLGDMYVDLVPGAAAAGSAIASGGTMPVAVTSSDVSDDQIFNAFNAATRQQEQQLLQTLDSATANHSGDIRSILPQLEQVSGDLDVLAQTYSADDAEVDATLLQLDTILTTTADEQSQISGLIDNGDTVVGAIATRDQALIATLARGAQLADEINTAAAPTVAQQRASLSELAPTLSQTSTLLNQISAPQSACGGKPCGISELIAETVDGNIVYPNDQLNITSAAGNSITNEWASLFSQPGDTDGNHEALSIVISFHCDEVSQTLSETLPGLSSAEQRALASACNAVTSGKPLSAGSLPKLPSVASTAAALQSAAPQATPPSGTTARELP